MGRLSDVLDHLDERAATVAAAEKALLETQARYESYFAELQAARENELSQLSQHVSSHRGQLPTWLETDLEDARAAVEKEFEAELERLRGDVRTVDEDAERARAESAAAEDAVRERNLDLDRREEALKERNAALLRRIADYNRRIAELGSGFGFFKNLFAMGRLRKERRKIDAEQEDVAAQVDRVRAQWVQREKEHAEREAGLRAAWTERRARAAALSAKLEYLEEARPRIVSRSTLERVLYTRFAEPEVPREDGPRCSRCQSPNAPGAAFCHICAVRLAVDRPDFEGSLQEIGELNHHHRKFAEGMKGCQQTIGLVRGLRSGLAAFRKSVEGVQGSEERYPLPKLRIDVPAEAVAFGRAFDALREAAQKGTHLHPQDFAAVLAEAARDLTPEAIQAYFQGMGEELTRCAKSQWK